MISGTHCVTNNTATLFAARHNKSLNYTFSLTFSKDAGDTTEKQTKNTSVCGYDSGLSRS